MSFKVISLFSGCGGSDLGAEGGFRYLGKNYRKNGVEIVHASDIDKFAVETYNANFKSEALVADINDLSFFSNSADIVIGGFPCQAFSTVNPTKKPGSKQNQLFWQMARVIGEVRPKVFVAENVKGFYRLQSGKYFQLAKDEFESLGYKVYHHLLNASHYGIPQLRERLIMVGIREDIKADYHFPVATHGPDSPRRKEAVALRQVIDSLIPEDPKFYFSDAAVKGAKAAKPNMKRLLAQDLSKPCLTITSHLAKVSINSRDPVLLVKPKKELYRRFTPREAARIQSFPEKFDFPVSDTQKYRQIGNAIPPVLMWHVFQPIIEILEGLGKSKFYKQKRVVRNLGDLTL